MRWGHGLSPLGPEDVKSLHFTTTVYITCFRGPCFECCKCSIVMFSVQVVKPRLHIHDFLYDSPRFLMVREIGMDRDESWRKVKIFSVTTIPVRMSTMLVRCL